MKKHTEPKTEWLLLIVAAEKRSPTYLGRTAVMVWRPIMGWEPILYYASIS